MNEVLGLFEDATSPRSAHWMADMQAKAEEALRAGHGVNVSPRRVIALIRVSRAAQAISSLANMGMGNDGARLDEHRELHDALAALDATS